VVVAYGDKPASLDPRLQWHAVLADPARYAQALYGLLRDLDKQGPQPMSSATRIIEHVAAQ